METSSWAPVALSGTLQLLTSHIYDCMTTVSGAKLIRITASKQQISSVRFDCSRQQHCMAMRVVRGDGEEQSTASLGGGTAGSNTMVAFEVKNKSPDPWEYHLCTSGGNCFTDPTLGAIPAFLPSQVLKPDEVFWVQFDKKVNVKKIHFKVHIATGTTSAGNEVMPALSAAQMNNLCAGFVGSVFWNGRGLVSEYTNGGVPGLHDITLTLDAERQDV
eukprot:gb/GFBE01010049.1/.p1 GENE.gb/GFBE01010049.1/~~gb/GFBE01010049.1/.p1  ORF type:complete len:217 (+),score=35.56 gb/GFBE01010049.1/:1-651(+)